MPPGLKVYCEHGALTREVRQLQRTGRVHLVHFPYDPGSRSRHLSPEAMPSAAQIRDLNLSYAELGRSGATWDDFAGSERLAEIQRILGAEHRRDVLHVDSAYKSGCKAFITVDTDILSHRDALQALLGIVFLDPARDLARLVELLTQDSRLDSGLAG